jgi:hypothetical protein
MQMKVPIRFRFQPIGCVPFPKQKPKTIYFFDYVKWDSINKLGFLKEKLGWKSPSDREQRFDCLLHCFGNYRWLQDCGISVDGFTYSTMIRDKVANRKDAISNERLIAEAVEEESLAIIEQMDLKHYKMPKY